MKLYRGLRVKDTRHIKDPIGIHWTTSLDVAIEFTKGDGIVLIAEIPDNCVVQHGTVEWEQYQYKYDMFEQGHREEERTIRKGSIVSVKSMILVRGNRTRRVKMVKTSRA